jgi:hypothetical protein
MGALVGDGVQLAVDPYQEDSDALGVHGDIGPVTYFGVVDGGDPLRS